MKELNTNVNLNQTVEVTCDECSNNMFVQGFLIRRVSRFLTGTNKDGIIPIPVLYCTKCNHVNSEFLPKELQEEEK